MKTASPSCPPAPDALAPRGRLDPWLALAVVAALAATFYPLLGVGFTCDDDLFTATARLRFGGPFRAAWAMASGHGRFYHLVIYPLAQVPFLFDSLEVANVFRILSSLSVFAALLLMVAEWSRSWSAGALVTLLAAGLLRTTHSYNPFHALPLWFNLGATLLFTSVFLFQRGLARGSRGSCAWAAVVFFGAMLTYEVFVLYVPLFFLLAVSSGVDRRGQRRALLPLAASAAVYLALYVGFRRAFPSGYAGTQMSLAPAGEMARTVAALSLSGLNLGFPSLRSLSSHPMPWIALVAAGAGAFRGLGALSAAEPPARVFRAMAVVLGCVFAPNVLFGLTERYRGWVQRGDDYYIGSFYSGFTAALLLGLVGWLLVRFACRLRRGLVVRVVLSAAVALMAHANAERSRLAFEPHHWNREVWRIAEGLVGDAGVTGLERATTVVAPTLQRSAPLAAYQYDYWSLYLSEKLGHPINVIDERDPAASLPPGPEETRFGVVVRYWPGLEAGLRATGRLDAELWSRDRGRVPCFRPHLVVTGRGDAFAVSGLPPGAHVRPASDTAGVVPASEALRVRVREQVVVDGAGAIDLHALELRP